MLLRSSIPVVAVNTVFTLDDVNKNSFRWAEVNISINGVASKRMLQLAKQARLDLQRIMGDVSDIDFSEPGDKLELKDRS